MKDNKEYSVWVLTILATSFTLCLCVTQLSNRTKHGYDATVEAGTRHYDSASLMVDETIKKNSESNNKQQNP